MGGFPTKRDFWYFFAIFIIIDIFLLVHWVTQPSILGARLELASTLVSIVLSVIAIIYTLVDSSNNKTTSTKIIDASNVIENVTNEINSSTAVLTELTKKLTDLEIDSKLNAFEQILNGVEQSICSMNDTVGNDISEIKNSLSKSIPDSITSTDIKNKEAFDKSSLQSLGIQLINTISEDYYHQKEIVYVSYKLKEADKPLFPQIGIYVRKHIIDENSEHFRQGICYCILGILSHLRCIGWKNKTNEITSFIEELKVFVDWFEKNEKDKVSDIQEFIKQA